MVLLFHTLHFITGNLPKVGRNPKRLLGFQALVALEDRLGSLGGLPVAIGQPNWGLYGGSVGIRDPEFG